MRSSSDELSEFHSNYNKYPQVQTDYNDIQDYRVRRDRRAKLQNMTTTQLQNQEERLVSAKYPFIKEYIASEKNTSLKPIEFKWVMSQDELSKLNNDLQRENQNFHHIADDYPDVYKIFTTLASDGYISAKAIRKIKQMVVAAVGYYGSASFNKVMQDVVLNWQKPLTEGEVQNWNGIRARVRYLQGSDKFENFQKHFYINIGVTNL